MEPCPWKIQDICHEVWFVTRAEHGQFQLFTLNAVYFAGAEDTYFWTGMKKSGGNTVFWAGKQPDGGAGEDCVAMKTHATPNLYDFPCNAKHRPLCVMSQWWRHYTSVQWRIKVHACPEDLCLFASYTWFLPDHNSDIRFHHHWINCYDDGSFQIDIYIYLHWRVYTLSWISQYPLMKNNVVGF